jgi:hypothetical protein
MAEWERLVQRHLAYSTVEHYAQKVAEAPAQAAPYRFDHISLGTLWRLE